MLLEVQAKHGKATAAKESKNWAFVNLEGDVHRLAIPCLVFSDKYDLGVTLLALLGSNALPAVTPVDKHFQGQRHRD